MCAVLPRARAVAHAASVTNVTLQHGDAYALPFPDQSFDVVHCHQMLCHLSEPCKALREMLRVTKSGGIVAAREGDFETECIWPDLAGLNRFHALVVNYIKSYGGSTTAGRQLLSWALEAGVKRSQIMTTFST